MPVCVYGTSNVHPVLLLSVVTSFLITNLPSLCPYHDTITDKCYHQSCSQFCAAHGTSLVHIWISLSATFKCPKEWHSSYLCKVWWARHAASRLPLTAVYVICSWSLASCSSSETCITLFTVDPFCRKSVTVMPFIFKETSALPFQLMGLHRNFWASVVKSEMSLG